MLKTYKVPSERNQCKSFIKHIKSTLLELEYSFINSQRSDRQILTEIRLENLKNQTMETHMKELQEENKQLFNIIEERHDDNGISRTASSTSCSTISMVHLQYKFEELLANQNGLLKVLEMRIADIRKYQDETGSLKEQIEIMTSNLDNCKDEISRLSQKLKELKTRKNNKITKLRDQRHSLAIAHNQLLAVLRAQWMERDDILKNLIMETPEPTQALLLQEVRKNNLLSYQNFQLQQENEYLQSLLKLKENKSNSCVHSESNNNK